MHTESSLTEHDFDWSFSRIARSEYSASVYPEGEDSAYRLQVVREAGVWEAHVLWDEDFDYDETTWPGVFLGFFGTAKEARAACEQYYAADEKTRGKMRRKLAKMLARKLASIERRENRDLRATIEKLSRVAERSPWPAEAETAKAKLVVKRRKLKQAGGEV